MSFDLAIPQDGSSLLNLGHIDRSRFYRSKSPSHRIKKVAKVVGATSSVGFSRLFYFHTDLKFRVVHLQKLFIVSVF